MLSKINALIVGSFPKKRTFGALFVLMLLLSLTACALTAGTDGRQSSSSEKDVSTERVSDNGLFLVRYQSDLQPAAINQMHTWVLHIDNTDGQPVEQAVIRIGGGMPDHGHGLGTAPQVTEELGGGDYRVEGIKYSMPGWWTMTFEITAAGQTDSVTFNLVLD
jgi:hypothetical protein